MEVKQLAELVNMATSEVIGDTAVMMEDLSNVVDIGRAIFDANAVDRYVKSLVNHIGKVVFVARPYTGSAPSVMMDSWMFGSVLEKIASEMPNAVENETWELEDGATYDPNVFHKPKAEAKFFNSMTTFEIDISVTDKQVRQSFSSAGQLNGFISMLFNEVDKSMTVKTDSLVMRTINNFIAETVYDAYQGGVITTAGNARAVNLLALYNAKTSGSLTAANALSDMGFLKFAAYTISLYPSRMSKMTTMFNMGGKQRFTPRDEQHLIMLDEFARAADVYLQSGTFHDQYTKLDKAELVSFWQGPGTTFNFADTSKIIVQTPSNHTQTVTGVLGVIFDRYALGVNCAEQRVNSNYNGKAEFTNYFYKRDARYFNDYNEQFVVFFIA